MELNGVSNVIMRLQEAHEKSYSFEKQKIIDKAIEDLYLFCKYVREKEKNPSLFWHEFKTKEFNDSKLKTGVIK